MIGVLGVEEVNVARSGHRKVLTSDEMIIVWVVHHTAIWFRMSS